jgi:hypothetical protein
LVSSYAYFPVYVSLNSDDTDKRDFLPKYSFKISQPTDIALHIQQIITFIRADYKLVYSP